MKLYFAFAAMMIALATGATAQETATPPSGTGVDTSNHPAAIIGKW